MKTCVIYVFASFFFFNNLLFDCGPVFRGDTKAIEKHLLDFQIQNFILNFLNKNLFKKTHDPRSLLDPEK